MSCGRASARHRPALRIATVLALIVAAGSLPLSLHAEERYTFDPEEIAKPAFTYGGYVQALGASQRLNTDAAQYRLQFYNAPRDQIDTGELRLHLDLGYRIGWLGLVFRGEGWRTDDYTGTTVDTTVQEAYFTAQPAPVFTLDVGKRVARWGKGYAWNPIAFVDRPKNPDDPELAQEGFVMARAVLIKSFAAALKTAELTLIDLPVRKNVNDDFGAKEGDNAAAKLYALIWNTDVDVAVLSAGTRTWRYGADFSSNITSNFEIHGEWATFAEVVQPVLDAEGTAILRTRTAQSWLAGVRYLTATELTAIAEYYSNGAGYSADELKAFYRFVDDAYDRFLTTGQDMLLKKGRQFAEGAYGQPNPGRAYGYLRVSQKEPFGWLYVTPAVTVVQNLEDSSYAATPELAYTGVTNLELRLRLMWLSGARFTDYGERPNRSRAELRVRYAF
jgi:hypothetical protein